MRPTIYIAVEVKSRELNSQLLLACKASLKGYRIYIGTHAAILKLLRLKSEHGGVFLDKGTLPVTTSEFIRIKCEKIAILDQELGPNREPNDIEGETNIVKGRIYPGVETLIDVYFVCNELVYAEAKSFLPDSVKVIITGWPRFEFQEDYSKKTFARLAKKISRKYGDFLLFATDLGPITPRSQLRSKSMLVRKNLEGITPDREAQIFEDASAIADFIRDWNLVGQKPRIILRPHTSENISEWARLINSRKTKIVRRNDITPWLLASKGLIHRGSTTSLQATSLKIPTYYFEGATRSQTRKMTRYNSTFRFQSASELLSGLAPESLSELVSTSNKMVLSNGSCDLIINYLDSINLRCEAKISRVIFWVDYITCRSSRRFVGLLRDELSYILNGTNVLPQSRYIPFGISTHDFRVIQKSEKTFKAIRARQIGINLIELESKFDVKK
jgi:surface carbohydrate biosynthesis protein